MLNRCELSSSHNRIKVSELFHAESAGIDLMRAAAAGDKAGTVSELNRIVLAGISQKNLETPAYQPPLYVVGDMVG